MTTMTSAESGQEHPHTMRLQRFLARAGVASRRGSEALMTAGRVTVNGVVATELGTKVDTDVDIVEVDGVRVRWSDEPVYLMLNKPAGYLTTMSDPQGRPCVAELVPVAEHPGLFPVGRLDFDTTGLLLFTTDGDLGHALLHPSHHVKKTYIALVDGAMHDDELAPLRRGIVLDDGPCQPAPSQVLERHSGTTLVEISLREGRKNQVKRMLGAIGHPVLELHRPTFGPLELTGIEEGSWRYLTDAEICLLRRAATR
ncbi:pseudouridine synthase [Enorma sp.]|uniref:pseudouridine synthase n=1 Tax=Enorma sp. TaxID=1920692 RepID=UPI003AB57E50